MNELITLKNGLVNKEQAVELALKLQTDMTLFTYPWQTQEQLENLIENISHKNSPFEMDELLSFYINDNFFGWTVLEIIPEESFGKIRGLYLRDYNAECLNQLIDYIEQKYKGLTFDFGLPLENTRMTDKMKSRGFQVLDSSLDYRFTMDDSIFSKGNIEILQKADYETYAHLHDAAYGPDMYWNSDRLRTHFDEFVILVLREKQEIIASAFLMKGKNHSYEIFGITETENETIYKALLEAALSLLRKNDTLIYFINADSSAERSMVESCGFQKNSSFVLLRKVI